MYASADGTVANGTLIRSMPFSNLSIKPGAAHPETIPLLMLPALADGAYHLVAQVTDPNGNVTSVASPSAYTIAAPFISLIPTAASLPTKQNSQGVFLPATFSFTLTNIGNINASGGTIAILASATNNLVGATVVLSVPNGVTLKPSVPHVVHFKLTPSQVNALENGDARGTAGYGLRMGSPADAQLSTSEGRFESPPTPPSCPPQVRRPLPSGRLRFVKQK